MKTHSNKSSSDMSPKIIKWMDGCWRETDCDSSVMENYINKAKELMERSNVIVFVNLDPDGLPVARAMLVAQKVKYTHFYFSTNSSSKHVNQIARNPVATLYMFDADTYEGLMLSGKAMIEVNPLWRNKIWEDSYSKYYSGVDDPDYCILRFDVDMCNYYHNATNVTFRM